MSRRLPPEYQGFLPRVTICSVLLSSVFLSHPPACVRQPDCRHTGDTDLAVAAPPAADVR